VPHWVASADLKAGLLRAARITRAGIERQWRVAIRADRDVPQCVSDLIHFLPQVAPGRILSRMGSSGRSTELTRTRR
jgi:hypothetical protein